MKGKDEARKNLVGRKWLQGKLIIVTTLGSIPLRFRN